jgi:hypothetical protein
MPAVRAGLLECLHDLDGFVRRAAAEALGQITMAKWRIFKVGRRKWKARSVEELSVINTPQLQSLAGCDSPKLASHPGSVFSV